MGRKVVRAVLITVGVIAVGPLTWWATLALPDEVPADRLPFADYMWNPPDLSGGQRLGVGLASAGAVSVAAWAMASGLRSNEIRREWLWVAASAAGIAGYAGLTYGVATTPVYGANIGAGLLVLGSFVVVPVLVGLTLWFARRPRSQLAR